VAAFAASTRYRDRIREHRSLARRRRRSRSEAPCRGRRLRGLKLHPPLQGFSPNDRIAYPLYEVFAEAKLPVLFHTGTAASGPACLGVAASAEVRQSDV